MLAKVFDRKFGLFNFMRQRKIMTLGAGFLITLEEDPYLW